MSFFFNSTLKVFLRNSIVYNRLSYQILRGDSIEKSIFLFIFYFVEKFEILTKVQRFEVKRAGSGLT